MVNEPKPKYKKALPIISIYFLGHTLKHTNAPVIKVARKYFNIITGKEIIEKEEFIESLTHDSYIIQIPYLKSKRQTELLILLSVFDQSNISHSMHILNVNENNFPEKYRPIIRRLQKAVVEPKVKDTMDIEDEIVEGLEILERDIAEREMIITEKEQIIKEKGQVIEEKEQVIEEKEQVIEEKEHVIEEKEQVIEEKDHVIIEKDKALKDYDLTITETINQLRERGFSDSEIVSITGLPIDKVSKI
jgi:hypothetical protein